MRRVPSGIVTDPQRFVKVGLYFVTDCCILYGGVSRINTKIECWAIAVSLTVHNALL